MVFHSHGLLVPSPGRGGAFWALSRKVLCPAFLTHTCPDRVHLTSHCPSVPGKKDGEMDRNFDTLDLPKRTEAAKGEWAEVESRPRPVQL